MKNTEWTLKTKNASMTVSLCNDRPVMTAICCENKENLINAQPIPLPEAYGISNTAFDWKLINAEADEKCLKFNFSDEKANCTCQAWVSAVTSMKGPFELGTTLTNGNAERLQIHPGTFFSVRPALRSGLTARWIAKEGGQAEDIHVEINGNHSFYPGKGLYEETVTADTQLKVWTDTNQDWNQGGHIPMIYLEDGTCGLYAALEWTMGEFLLKDGILNADLSIKGDFITRVDAGKTFVLPTMYFGAYLGDWDDGANIFKRWFLYNKAPKNLIENEKEPYNQLDIALTAAKNAEIGVESVKWDYGWWSDCARGSVGNWSPYEGSWQVRAEGIRKNFENLGIKNMGEYGAYLKAQGILNWTVYVLLHDTLDPEGNPTDKYGEFNSVTHPDWFSERRIDKGMGCSADLGNTECVAWLKENLKKFFTENNIGTWRTDFEPISRSSNLDNRHFANGADVQYWTSTGFFEVVDSLLAEIPGFRYESCCSGGGMKDFATLRRCTIVNNEDTANYLSNRVVFYDSSYAMHPVQLQAPTNPDTFCSESKHYYPKIESNQPDLNEKLKHLGFRALIMSAPMSGSWSGPENSESYRFGLTELFDYYYHLYSNRVRPLMKEGDLYHVLPRPDGIHWDGMQYAAADSANETKGALFVFKPAPGEDSKNIKLRGLKSNVLYHVTSENDAGSVEDYTGSELMEKGLTVTLTGDVNSDILWITEA